MKMASRETEFTSTCLICFETRALKIAGRCKHSFCSQCLSTVFDNQEGEVFPCPTCQTDCPRPRDGVKGLVDFTGEAVDRELETLPVLDSPEQAGGPEPSTTSENIKDSEPDNVVSAKCQICLHKKKDVKAVVMCINCGHFYYCQDCSNAHAKNKATRNHSVAALRPDRREKVATCKLHNIDLTSYCQNCNTAVCTVCVMLTHGDHDIEDLSDTIQSKVGQVSAMLKKEENKLKELETLKQELTALEVEAQTVDKQESLIKEIEEHAQTCLDQIITWKEQLKDQVTEEFKVIRDIPECLKEVSKAIEKLREPLNRASQLLSQTENHQEYLDKLVSQQQNLEAIGQVDVGGEVKGRWEYEVKISDLRRKDIKFIPAIDFNCGKLERTSLPGPSYFSLPELAKAGGMAAQTPRQHFEPHFEPVVELPEEVVQTTGEEDETVLYKNDRARLYRFSEGQWKERGTGPVKLLKNKTNGKVRFLMRREQVLKICANHFFHGGMKIIKMTGSKNAFMWIAQDFAEEQVKNEQFALKLKNEEMATEFQNKFLEAVQLANTSGKDTETPSTEIPVVSLTPKSAGTSQAPNSESGVASFGAKKNDLRTNTEKTSSGQSGFKFSDIRAGGFRFSFSTPVATFGQKEASPATKAVSSSSTASNLPGKMAAKPQEETKPLFVFSTPVGLSGQKEALPATKAVSSDSAGSNLPGKMAAKPQEKPQPSFGFSTPVGVFGQKEASPATKAGSSFSAGSNLLGKKATQPQEEP